MTKFLLPILLGLAVPGATTVSDMDDFTAIKQQLADAGCIRLEFTSIIESDIFDTVDSTDGEACLASDGRYRISLGDDEYLYDGKLLYTYSADNNQVTVEKLDTTIENSQEVTFLSRLDELYETMPTNDRNRYHLRLREAPEADLPGSMTVLVGGDPPVIQSLEFYDINDDFNQLILYHQQLDSACAEDDFVPDFPESAETVKLF